MNRNIQTILIAPMTTKSHYYPSRAKLSFQGNNGWIVLDQIRTVDRRRLVKKLGKISDLTIRKIKSVLAEMLVA